MITILIIFIIVILWVIVGLGVSTVLGKIMDRVKRDDDD